MKPEIRRRLYGLVAIATVALCRLAGSSTIEAILMGIFVLVFVVVEEVTK